MGPMTLRTATSAAPDRLKVGSTEAGALQQIAAQIGTSTPDRPILYLEINCRILECALHAMLARGHKFTAIEGAHGFGRTTK
jgi:hypothetical protein